MEEMSEKITKSSILKHFAENVPDVIVYDITDSTNTRARELLNSGKQPPFLLAADRQTAGRGRHGNRFFSPERGLYYTLSVRPDDMDTAIAKTTIAAAVSLRESVLEICDRECRIKWVNDLYYDQKKVAGILCEAPRSSDGTLSGIIIGIGVNIVPQDFPPELAGKAGSLNCPDCDRNALTAALTKRLLYWCDHLNDPKLICEYKKHSLLLGREVSFVYNGSSVTGIAEDINEDGNLLVRSDRLYVLNSGEVSLTSW